MEGNQMHTILTRRPQSGGGKSSGGGDDDGGGNEVTTTINAEIAEHAERKTFCSAGPASTATYARQMAKKIKLKTHRGAAKRFKRTKNGKFLRGAGVQAAHPDQQDQEAEAQAHGNDDRRRRGCAEARADAAV